MKRLLFAMSVIVVGIAGCAQPCSKIADSVCLAHGAASELCRESRDFADRAGVTERGQCRIALKIVGSLGSTGTAVTPVR